VHVVVSLGGDVRLHSSPGSTPPSATPPPVSPTPVDGSRTPRPDDSAESAARTRRTLDLLHAGAIRPPVHQWSPPNYSPFYAPGSSGRASR